MNINDSEYNTDSSKITQNDKTYDNILEQINYSHNIDPEIENFKNSFENLFNKFKIESLNNLINTKKKIITNCEYKLKKSNLKLNNLISDKELKITELNNFINKVNDDNIKLKNTISNIKNKYHNYYNNNIKKNILKKCFFILIINNKSKKYIKNKNKIIINNIKKVKKQKIFNYLKHQIIGKTIERNINIKKKELEDNYDNIISRINEENVILNEKLNEALKKLEYEQVAKSDIYSKIKNAFMKGIYTMNMEAMGSLNISNIIDDNFNSQINNNVTNNNNTEIKTNINNEKLSVNNNIENNFTKNFYNSNNKNSNNILNKGKYINNIKPESKDHKYQKAPILNRFN